MEKEIQDRNREDFKEMVKDVASRTDYSEEACLDIISAFCETMRSTILARKNVYLKHFAKLKIITVKERTRYNPHADNHMRIPAHPKVRLEMADDILEAFKPEIQRNYEFSKP